jgi:hypothetical protein
VPTRQRPTSTISTSAILRSVVAAGEDPMVARDESTRAIANELKTALAAKQESELRLWFEDIDAAISVGRVIRALKLSSQPPEGRRAVPHRPRPEAGDGHDREPQRRGSA